MKCPKCNQEIEDNSIFCEYCGAKIEKKQSSEKPVEKTEPHPKINSNVNKNNNNNKWIFYVGGAVLAVIVIIALVSINSISTNYYDETEQMDYEPGDVYNGDIISADELDHFFENSESGTEYAEATTAEYIEDCAADCVDECAATENIKL